MIISRTPFRINFLGGSTDYRPWFERHGGVCLSTTINRYCYLSVRPLPPFFEHRHRIVYSKVEAVHEISEIQHPAARAVLEWCKIRDGLEIHHDADLPAWTGVGSASAFTVGLLTAVQAHLGKLMNPPALADAAIHLQHEIMKEPVGYQDQVCAAYGGFNVIRFRGEGEYEVEPIGIARERQKALEDRLLLFFTGVPRHAKDMAARKLENLSDNEAELEQIQGIAEEGIAILRDADRPLGDFGALMNESWKAKQALAKGISSERIDEIYQAGLDAGATGGKLMGAGGGGIMMFYVEPEKQASVLERFDDLIRVPFEFEPGGARIVLYHPSGLA